MHPGIIIQICEKLKLHLLVISREQHYQFKFNDVMNNNVMIYLNNCMNFIFNS